MKNYVIGLDFGTLSARAVLADTVTGEELAQAVYTYPHAVMDKTLPCGVPLPPTYALQHPQDYLEALGSVIPAVLEKSGIGAELIGGISIDITACTPLPVDKAGTPLCMKPEFSHLPHAYAKLWKHHGGQTYADEINALAIERNEKWLPRYGSKVSSEWYFPKLLEFVREAPELVEQTYRFMEAGDWLTWMLTGQEVYSASYAGYKSFWSEADGFPDDDFLTALEPKLKGVVGGLIGTPLSPIATKAGVICDYGSKLTGLLPGTPVAVPTIDGHTAMPALNITEAGQLMLTIGTSTCHIINGEKDTDIPGICGHAKDAVIPGLNTYEAGQSCVGDGFDWFIRNSVPASYAAEAQEKKLNLHQLLQQKAEALRPGQSGLVALDWLNGNRSILADFDLTGVVVGLTLQTKPEDIYRAFLEATAYGTRMIVEQYETHGVPIHSICAGGGISQKNSLMMQIYADVTGRSIRVAGSDQACAMGSVIYAAVAAGIFPTVEEASARFSRPDQAVYHPIPENQAAYEPLYRIYKTLHDYFGKENADLLHGLKPKA